MLAYSQRFTKHAKSPFRTRVQYEKVSSLFQDVKLLEYADGAEVSGCKGKRHPGRPSANKAMSSLPSRLSGASGGDGGGLPKASVALENLHVAITVDCSRPAAKG